MRGDSTATRRHSAGGALDGRVDAAQGLVAAGQVHRVRDVRADLGAGDGHAQRLRHLAHAQAQRVRGGLQLGGDGVRRPVAERGQAVARLGQRRARLGLEVLGHGLVVVAGERVVPDRRALGHVLQRLHAVTERHHHVGRRGARGGVVAGGAQVPFQVARDLGGIVGLQVLLVEPAELGRVHARRLGVHVLQVEQALHLLDGEDLLVAVGPAQADQVVEQRVRQVAHVAVLHDVGGAGALAELRAVLVEDHRQVRERRRLGAQRAVDVDLARGVVDVVVAAHHVGDAHVQVVHHHGEVVGGIAVGPEDHQVVELGVGDLDAALDLVVPGHHAVERVLQADDAVGIVAPGRAAVAVGAVVARLLAGGHGGLAHGVQLLARFVGIVGMAGGHQLFGHLAIALHAGGLVDGAFVVVQAQPVHRLEDGVDRGLGAALAVGVLDAQDELPAAAARLQPAVQRGAGTTDVQVAGGAGGEAGAAGHGGWRRGVTRHSSGSPRGGPAGAAPAGPYNPPTATLFISDLHRDPERPGITRLFGAFLDGEARRADALYILGDLFEAWVGDDDPSEAGAFVAGRLRALVDAGVPVSFIRGNRDFLLGAGYARRSGMRLLPDPTVVVLHGEPTLLLHGDLLCPDDVAYQQFRVQTRDPAWQARFLAQPLQARLAFAAQARAASQARHGELQASGMAEAITDVAPATVQAWFA